LFSFIQSKYSGCTAEACDLRDNFERFKANNYELLGVSADAQAKQAKFKENIIPFRY
jgi:peroxiredoxin Q/BCP